MWGRCRSGPTLGEGVCLRHLCSPGCVVPWNVLWSPAGVEGVRSDFDPVADVRVDVVPVVEGVGTYLWSFDTAERAADVVDETVALTLVRDPVDQRVGLAVVVVLGGERVGRPHQSRPRPSKADAGTA
jgi:hypothetical protein